jgi:hypothetical protein
MTDPLPVPSVQDILNDPAKAAAESQAIAEQTSKDGDPTTADQVLAEAEKDAAIALPIAGAIASAADPALAPVIGAGVQLAEQGIKDAQAAQAAPIPSATGQAIAIGVVANLAKTFAPTVQAALTGTLGAAGAADAVAALQLGADSMAASHGDATAALPADQQALVTASVAAATHLVAATTRAGSADQTAAAVAHGTATAAAATPTAAPVGT